MTILGRRRKVVGRGEQSGLNLRGAFLKSLALKGSEFQLADFTKAEFQDAVLEECNFALAIFKESELFDSQLINCILIEVDFTSAYARGARFLCDDSLPNPYRRVALRETHGTEPLATTIYRLDPSSLDEDTVTGGRYFDSSQWSGADVEGASFNNLDWLSFQPLDLSGIRGMDTHQYASMTTPTDAIRPNLWDLDEYEGKLSEEEDDEAPF